MKTVFRVVGLLEALSFLILLGVAMPLKYIYGFSEATRTPGMVHGLLFLAFLYFALRQSDEENWSRKQLILAFVASVLPLGTIIFDRVYLSSKSTESKV